MDSSMDMATQVTTFRMKSIWEMINQDIMMRRPMAKAVTTKPVSWRRTWQVAFSQKRLEKEEEALSTDPGHAAFHSLDVDRRGRRPPVKRSAFFLMGLALRLLVSALSLPQDLSRIIVYMPSSEFPGSRLHNPWRLVFRGVTLAIQGTRSASLILSGGRIRAGGEFTAGRADERWLGSGGTGRTLGTRSLRLGIGFASMFLRRHRWWNLLLPRRQGIILGVRALGYPRWSGIYYGAVLPLLQSLFGDFVADIFCRIRLRVILLLVLFAVIHDRAATASGHPISIHSFYNFWHSSQN